MQLFNSPAEKAILTNEDIVKRGRRSVNDSFPSPASEEMLSSSAMSVSSSLFVTTDVHSRNAGRPKRVVTLRRCVCHSSPSVTRMLSVPRSYEEVSEGRCEGSHRFACTYHFENRAQTPTLHKVADVGALNRLNVCGVVEVRNSANPEHTQAERVDGRA